MDKKTFTGISFDKDVRVGHIAEVYLESSDEQSDSRYIFVTEIHSVKRFDRAEKSSIDYELVNVEGYDMTYMMMNTKYDRDTVTDFMQHIICYKNK